MEWGVLTQEIWNPEFDVALFTVFSPVSSFTVSQFQRPNVTEAHAIAASDPLKAWLDGGCPPEAKAALLEGEISAKSIYGPVLDLVFGRGAYSQLSVAATPPGCEGVAEDEWELQMDEDLVAVEQDEYLEVPFDVRIMHGRGSRGYEAALEEHMSNVYDERTEECQGRQRRLKMEMEKTEVRRRAWGFAQSWLAAAAAAASYADVAAAIEAVEGSEATFRAMRKTHH